MVDATRPNEFTVTTVRPVCPVHGCVMVCRCTMRQDGAVIRYFYCKEPDCRESRKQRKSDDEFSND